MPRRPRRRLPRRQRADPQAVRGVAQVQARQGVQGAGREREVAGRDSAKSARPRRQRWRRRRVAALHAPRLRPPRPPRLPLLREFLRAQEVGRGRRHARRRAHARGGLRRRRCQGPDQRRMLRHHLPHGRRHQARHGPCQAVLAPGRRALPRTCVQGAHLPGHASRHQAWRSSSSSRRWRGARPSRSTSLRRPSPSSASTAGKRCRGGPTQTATARRRATPTPGLWRRRGQPEPTNIYSRARVVSRGEWRGPWIGGQLDQLPHRAASPSHHDEDIRLYACGESQWTRSRSDVSVVREGRRGTREVWAT
ncbi:hypothetical protein EMIHUDRAFT_442824 [Emiliania huxleyi CCMP1516]|uniref:Uncharacterized protein n=2 Tax=Emiliania huxleyi TaxID=2903 RepID=A0A0D3JZU0_EMIH1|nr:hypothetical protein EMIHUDRAFT_442824 [Emiliania huxleyi CCMP1516]EOD29025.1 hypothetical protein EMIHUDRAFT_442824 [Emiliania huxleyi CCMP1516]|eukprot:XP_005781454.1 hypothetical protein EMIHUDRAFT_442824 [Emiliania huxleyi CCMP1516]